MTSRLTEIAFDCADPAALAEFWCAALGYVVVDAEEQVVEIAPSKIPDAELVEAFRRGPADPSLIFIQVPEGKSAKNRLHLDISPVDCTHAEEVARMESLGARKADLPRAENQSWTVMLDPEDNEFCVLRSLAPGEFSL